MTIECSCGWRSSPANRRRVIIEAIDHELKDHPESPEKDARWVKARNILDEMET